MPVKRHGARCWVTVHSFFVNHGKHTGFSRTENHPCYLRAGHDGEHRC
jgi:hypothetical protein